MCYTIEFRYAVACIFSWIAARLRSYDYVTISSVSYCGSLNLSVVIMLSFCIGSVFRTFVLNDRYVIFKVYF